MPFNLSRNMWMAGVSACFLGLFTTVLGIWLYQHQQITIPQHYSLLPAATYLFIGLNVGYNLGQAVRSKGQSAFIFWFIYFGVLFGLSSFYILTENVLSLEFWMSIFLLFGVSFFVNSDLYDAKRLPWLQKIIDVASRKLSFLSFAIYVVTVHIILPGLLGGAFLLYFVIMLVFFGLGILTMFPFKTGPRSDTRWGSYYDIDWVSLIALAGITFVIGLVLGLAAPEIAKYLEEFSPPEALLYCFTACMPI